LEHGASQHVSGATDAIATSHPLATQAGQRVLADGGNFMDAALCAAAVLNVAEPWASQLGGDVFMLIHDGGRALPVAINGSGRSPRRLDPARYTEPRPWRGIHSATVPGEVHGWCAAHTRYGSLPMTELLAPAIELAERGFEIDDEFLRVLGIAPEAHGQPGFAAQFLPGGEPPPLGSILKQPALAHTLRQLASEGAGALYQGAVAERLLEASRRLGGGLCADDLAGQTSYVGPAISLEYRGWTIHEQPPPSQGLIVLCALGLWEALGAAELPHDDARRVHVAIEAMRLASADVHAYLADPEFEDFDAVVQSLLDRFRLRSRAAEIDWQRAGTYAAAPLHRGRSTTYLAVGDRTGRAVSFIQSLYYPFGSGVVVDGTGILLNNRMNGFDVSARHPNRLRGGVRPRHTLNTWMAFRGGELRYVGGTPGGDKQVQWNFQIIRRLLDDGMTIEQANAAPRWAINDAGGLDIEADFGRQVIDGLMERGHALAVVPPRAVGGRVQLLERDPATQRWSASCDPRCRGTVGANLQGG